MKKIAGEGLEIRLCNSRGRTALFAKKRLLMSYDNSTETEKRRMTPLSQATQVMNLLADRPIFHDQLERCFLEVRYKGHIENWLIDDPRTLQWLSNYYFEKFEVVPSATALKDAIVSLKGKALFKGEMRPTSLRAAFHEDNYYLDLGDNAWQVIRIATQGWTILPNSPTAFYRTPVLQALETPKRGGSLELLWELINIPPEYQILVITFLIECLRPNTNYPVLVIEGEQGSAKSTTQRYLKALIDPSAIMLRVPPKKIADVYVASSNDHLLSFNNLSQLSGDLQDAICCFSTGGTHAERKLYTNNQESVINVQCPIMFNGIGGLVTRQDLIERCIYLELPRIVDGDRRTEAQLETLFAEGRPQILGALLDIMTQALSMIPNISTNNLPRMADYCLLGRAVAKAMDLDPLDFDRVYAQNQLVSVEKSLEACPIYPALLGLLSVQNLGFSGNYQELLRKLEKFSVGDRRFWPSSPKALSSVVKRIAPALRKVGVVVHFDNKRRTDGYHLTIRIEGNQVHHVHAAHLP